MFKRIFSVILCAVIIVCALPVATYAYCPECGEEKDISEYCTECYKCHGCTGDYCLFCNRCADCAGEMCDRCDEVCLECHGELDGDDDSSPCPDCHKCKQDGTDYCLVCKKCEDCVEICCNCNEVCVDCHEDLGGEGDASPCSVCHKCKQDGTDYCLFCGRCTDCVEICDRCNEVCLECHDELGGVDEYSACPDCGYCKNGMDYCTSCGVCAECDDVCAECQLCVECALDEGSLHCPECSECYAVNSQCPSGEEHCYEHCVICEDCGECFYGNEGEYCDGCKMCISCAVGAGLHCEDCEACSRDVDDFCDNCGLCEECCLSGGLHCPLCLSCYDDADKCDDGEHCTDCCVLCEECGGCFLESGEYCSLCQRCNDCCLSASKCILGMCEGHPGYKAHFCSDCKKCFDEVNQCTLCSKNGKTICIDCCEHKEIFSCTTHTYGENDTCSKCAYVKTAPTGKPVFIQQPQDVTAAAVTDGYAPDYLQSNIISYRVAVDNYTDATYKWYYSSKPQGADWVEFTEDMDYVVKDCDKSVIKLVLFCDACYNTTYIKCVVTNKFGSTESACAKMQAMHQYISYTPYDYYGHYHYWCEINNNSKYHAVYCCGDGCDSYLASTREEHTYGAWQISVQPTDEKVGKKVRYCSKCGSSQTEALPKTHTCQPSTEIYFGTVIVDGMKKSVHGHKCTICGEFTDYGYHTLQRFNDSFATETAEGKWHYYCTNCDFTEYYTVPKLAHTHDYLKAGYNDFTEKEYKRYGTFDANTHWSVCLDKLENGRCLYKHSVQQHDYGYWIVDSAQMMYRKCTVCGYCETAQ